MVQESELSINQAIEILRNEMNELAGLQKCESVDDAVYSKYKALQIALTLMQKQSEPGLMNLKEFCEYTGLGMTKAREILKRKNSTFTVRVGNRLYAHKKLFDDYVERCAKYQIPI